MKKIFVILTFAVLAAVPGFSATRYVTTQSPLPDNYYNNRYSAQNYTSVKLADAEMSLYGRTYENQNLYSRLNRLEKSVFNRTYPNMSIDRRVDNLIVNYNNNANDTPINSSNNKWKKVLDNVSSSFFGCPTGFTPPVNPYYSYGSNSYGSDYGHYQDYYGRNGWAMRNNSIGTGTGIHILD